MAIVIDQKVSIGDLNVKDIYQELMEVSTGQNSAYLRTKETLQDLVDSSTLTDREKSEVISKTLSGIAGNITNSALDAAIKIATENRDAPFALAKVSADTAMTLAQTTKLGKDELLVEEQTKKLSSDIDKQIIDGWYTQGKLIADTGLAPNANTSAAIISDQTVSAQSKAYQDIKLGEAKVYESWSGALMANGNVAYTVANGMPTLITLSSTGLVKAQTDVAVRQEKAFDDNMRQHAANSSASMIGVLLGSEAFTDPADYNGYLTHWTTSLTYLNT